MNPIQTVTTDASRQIIHSSIIQVGSQLYAYSTDAMGNDQWGVRLFTSDCDDGLWWIDRSLVLTPQSGTFYDHYASFPGVIRVDSTSYMVFEACSYRHGLSIIVNPDNSIGGNRSHVAAQD